MYTKFGLNRFIGFQDIEQKLNNAGMTERETEREGQTGQIQYSPTFSKLGYNKGTDQLRSNCADDLCLYFRICKKQVFS